MSASRRGGEFELDALEGMARVLTDSGHYRVLRRFRPRERYAAADGGVLRTGLYVDVETTGKDGVSDAIIEFGGVPFEYSAETGRIYSIGKGISAFEDPGFPIPHDVVELTRITDEMVSNHRFDDDQVCRLVATANLVVAHHAAFDRTFLERRFPVFAQKQWACGMADVPWHLYGCRGTKLEYILFNRCAEYFDGHRALEDCLAGIHVLATPLPCGTVPFSLLLREATVERYRVWAFDAPYDRKDVLKARGYKWHAGSAEYPKSWYRDLTACVVDVECAWLNEAVYANRRPTWEKRPLSGIDRYSGRM